MFIVNLKAWNEKRYEEHKNVAITKLKKKTEKKSN